MQASITFGNLNGTTDSPPFVKRVCVPTSPSESSDAGTLIGGNGGDRGSSVAGGGIRHRTVDRTGSCDGSSVVRSGHSPEEPSVAPLQEVCVIDDECFQAPSGYRQLGRAGLQLMGTEDVFDDEEQMLQYAIRQSLQSQAGQPQTRRGDGREQVGMEHTMVCMGGGCSLVRCLKGVFTKAHRKLNRNLFEHRLDTYR